MMYLSEIRLDTVKQLAVPTSSRLLVEERPIIMYLQTLPRNRADKKPHHHLPLAKMRRARLLSGN